MQSYILFLGYKGSKLGNLEAWHCTSFERQAARGIIHKGSAQHIVVGHNTRAGMALLPTRKFLVLISIRG
jgi:hypothetical protein